MDVPGSPEQYRPDESNGMTAIILIACIVAGVAIYRGIRPLLQNLGVV